MTGSLADAFVIGLTQAPICAGVCVPAILPPLLSRDDTRVSSHAVSVAMFMAGRLAGYVAVGFLFGWLGAKVSGGLFSVVLPVAQALIGAALLLYAVSETTRKPGLCKMAHQWGNTAYFPLLIGVLSSVNLCPPFVAAVQQVMAHGGALYGAAYFLVFFLATSLVMIPVFFIALGNIVKALRSVGRVACAAVGLVFICTAVSDLAPHLGLAGPVGVAQTPPAVTTQVEAQVVKPLDEKALALLQETLPAATGFVAKEEPLRHFVAVENSNALGVVGFSTDLAPGVEGFGGSVPVVVALDAEGRILNVVVGEHEETPAYFSKVERAGLLKKLIGKRYSDPIEIGRDVDAVTGATESSRAIVDGVRLTARRFAEVLGGKASKVPPEGASTRWFDPWYLVFILLVGVSVLGELRRVKWLRYVVLAAAFLCLGVWRADFFSVHHLSQISLSATPVFVNNILWYVVPVAALGLALFMGRVYCAWLCPFGALSELLGRLCRSPIQIDLTWDRRLRRIKYIVLPAVLFGVALFGHIGLLRVEPFVDTFTLGFLFEGTTAGIVLRVGWLVVVFAGCALIFRGFCRYVCPAGAAMAFIARHRIFGRIRPEGCVECGECGVSCPKRDGRP